MLKLPTNNLTVPIQSYAAEAWTKQRVRFNTFCFIYQLLTSHIDSYIKELADKLANLESHVMGAPTQPNQIMESTHSSPQASNELARIADMDYSRKRNHSASEDLSPHDYIGTERYPPPGGWSGQDGADQTPQYESSYYTQGASQNGYTGVNQYVAGPRASMMSNGADPINGHGQSSTQDTNNMNLDVAAVDANWQWDEESINTCVKPTLLT